MSTLPKEAIEGGIFAARVSALEPVAHLMEQMAGVLKAVITWASSRCHCHEETPNPCPLCGASVENLEACKSVEAIFPRQLLSNLRAVLASYKRNEEKS